MKICVNLDPAKAFTTGTPSRGMLKTLLYIRPDDFFILCIHKGTQNLPSIQMLLSDLERFPNWELYIKKTTSRQTNILKLIGYPACNQINIKADVYINFDADDMGPHNKPLVTLLADLSVKINPEESSHGYIGRRLRNITFNRMARFSDKIVVISKRTQDDLKHYFPGLSGKDTVIYNGIENRWFDKPVSNQTLKYTSYLLWYGYYSPRKNLDRIFSIYAKLIKKKINSLPNLLLIVSGSSDRIATKINELGVSEKVFILPAQNLDALIDYVDQSIALLFPSIYEGFGLPVVEAMARGKYVYCSDTGSLREISGNLCTYFSPVDLLEIEKVLIQIAQKNKTPTSNPELKKWANQFTYHASAQKYSDLIDSLTVTMDHSKTAG